MNKLTFPDWNYAVRVENNALLKKLKEIKNKKNNENIKIPNEDNFKTSKMSSLHKKTLNIDQRISSLKKIMKENEVIRSFLNKFIDLFIKIVPRKKTPNSSFHNRCEKNPKFISREHQTQRKHQQIFEANLKFLSKQQNKHKFLCYAKNFENKKK